MHEMTADLDVELREEPLADGACRDARGRLARRRTLENVARVVAVVLEYSRQVGVARPHPRDGTTAWIGITFPRSRVHHVLPVLPIAVRDQHRDGCADGLT